MLKGAPVEPTEDDGKGKDSEVVEGRVKVKVLLPALKTPPPLPVPLRGAASGVMYDMIMKKSDMKNITK